MAVDRPKRAPSFANALGLQHPSLDAQRHDLLGRLRRHPRRPPDLRRPIPKVAPRATLRDRAAIRNSPGDFLRRVPPFFCDAPGEGATKMMQKWGFSEVSCRTLHDPR